MSQPANELQTALQDTQMIKALMGRGLKLPPQPRVVEDLHKCRLRQEKNLRVVSRIISQDAGITALLFRAVQSPVYREHQPFTSVEKILQALGIDQVFNLVQAIALATASTPHAHRKTYEHFWESSSAIAHLAMLIAEDRISVCNVFPDQAYLAGVFHNCGVPLLMERFPAYGRNLDINRQGAWLSLAEEDRSYQTDHAVVGYFVAKHWRLPDFICDAIRFHHDLLRLNEHNARSMVAILQMASHLYCRSLHCTDPEWTDAGPVVLEELGMDENTAPEFIDEILEQYCAEAN